MNSNLDEKPIFKAAFALPREDRHEFLVAACQGDNVLLARIETLLRQAEEDSAFLESPPVPMTGEGGGGGTPSADPTQIGPYRIREKIGEGGMGVVYVAEQTEPVQRKVAIKVIKPGMDTQQVIARFEAERQALAFMEHPNIARVLDAGATESGRSYFVMELVRGIPITEYCDQVKATPQERLKLFQTVCDAVQHAHQKGIIHRDIKPSNVLVTQDGTKPVVKVIDFGLAKSISGQKLTERTLYTGFMQLLGTPVYMSPEQVGQSGMDVDTRSDVYSLGILLYELLTGTTPLDKTTIQRQAYEELCRQVREVEAPKPSSRFSTLKDKERLTIAQQRQVEPMRLGHLLNGDLDVVVLKALEKDRDRRYGTPQDFAADVERYLNDQPVLAVPASQLYLARKYFHRHSAAILTAAAILGFLVLATAFSTWQAIRATQYGREADASKQKAVAAQDVAERAKGALGITAELRRRELYASNMQLAGQLLNSPAGSPREIEQLLAAWIPLDDSHDDLREFTWRYQWSRLHLSAFHTVPNTHTATISDAGDLITASESGVRQWDESGQLVADLWTGDASQAVLSPDGRWAAIPFGEMMQLIDLHSNTDSGDDTSPQAARQPLIQPLAGTRLTFSADSQFLACWGAEGEIAVSSISTSPPKAVAPLRLLDAESLPRQGNLGLASDGESYVIKGVERPGGTNADAIAVLSGRDKPVICQRDRAPVGGYAWSVDGAMFAVGNLSGKIHIYRAADPDESIVFRSHGKQITAIEFSSDGTKLASGGSNGTIDIWEIVARETSDTPSAASEAKSLASGAATSNGQSEGPSLAPTAQSISGMPTLSRSIKAFIEPVRSISFSADGTELASTDTSGLTRRWYVEDDDAAAKLEEMAPNHYGAGVGIEVDVDQNHTTVASVAPGFPAAESDRISDGDRIIGMSDDANTQMLNVAGKNSGEIGDLLVGPPGSILRLHIQHSSDNSHESDNSREVVELPRKSLAERTLRVAFAPDGGSLAIASERGGVVWGIGDHDARRVPARCCSVAYSSDGRFLAMDDRTQVVLWDLEHDRMHAELETGQRGRPMAFRTERGASLAFSPDGKYLAAGTGYPFNHRPKRSDLVVWDLSRLNETKDSVAGKLLLENGHVFTALNFTPDGKSLVALDHAGVLRVWNTTTWSPPKTVELGRAATAMDISSDGRTLAIGFGQSLSNNKGIIIWDLVTGAERQNLKAERPMGIAFSPDGKTLASTSERHDVELWDVRSGRQLRRLHGHTNMLFGVAFSKDGSKLATSDSDGTLRIWKAASQEQIDRDPLTLRAMYRLGTTRNQERRFADAKATLVRTLLLQQKWLPEDDKDVAKTHAQIAVAVDGLKELDLAETVEHPPPPGDSTPAPTAAGR